MDRPQAPRKILRSPSLKRKNRPVPITERATLERVLGVTVSGNSSLAVCQNTGTIIYPAGCVLVLLNARKNRQSHIINSVKKTITAVAISPDGKYVVTGECGHQPYVRVWDLEEKNVVAEFSGHKFGIKCVAFSPNMKQIVSVGSQHDMMVNVWNWKTKTKFASNKVSSKVNNVAFSADGSYFVTAGNRHVKFWYLVATKSRIKETAVLNGRSGILGEQRNNFFTDVACGNGDNSGSTFCITQSGLLCEFNDKRLLDKWVELRTKSANCITVSLNYIFIGCADGIVRLFHPRSLHFIATVPRPHYIGVDVAAGLDPSHMVTHNSSAKFPHVIATAYDETNKKLTCVYNDHSLYVWDLKDVKKIGKAQSYLYHSHCVWNVETYPELPDEAEGALPRGSFITCSSDDTIRIWNLDQHTNIESGLKRNIYSNDLLKIIYTDEELNFVCNNEYNPAGAPDKTDTYYDGKNGIRAIKISPDGAHLASGDRTGNVRIHSLHFMNELCTIEAHDGEVLCLEYNTCTSKEKNLELLATASRDRLIHVFDVKKDYNLLQTLDDHSASITAVRFAGNDEQLRMLSCGADKSLLFRTADMSSESDGVQFLLNHNLAEKATMYDMGIDPTNRFAATACQDRNIRIYNIRTGKQRKCYKGTLGDDGTLIKVQLDPSGRYAATSSSDKNLSIIDFMSGECVSSMYAHSEIAPGLQFTNDFKHLIVVSGDSCVYVWKLHPEFTDQMKQRKVSLQQQDFTDSRKEKPTIQIKKAEPMQQSYPPTTQRSRPSLEGEDVEYSFNVTQLPTWAKKQILKGSVSSPDYANRRASIPQSFAESTTSVWKKVLHEEIDLNGPLKCPEAPKGRWAQRVDNDGIFLKSTIDEENVSLSLSAERRRFTVEPEVLEEQCKKLEAMRRETLVLASHRQPLTNIPVIQPEDEDDDDEEFFKMGATRESTEGKAEDYASPTVPGRGTDREARRRRFIGTESPSVDYEDEEAATDDSDEHQVIYYPASEDEGQAEGMENSYHVFALSPDELRHGRSGVYRSFSNRTAASDTSSPRDLDSEFTENTLDDGSDEEYNESSPTTPIDPNKQFIEDPVEKEEYLKQTFENLGASPMFLAQSDESVADAAPSITQRLSISSKFLSRAQQTHLRNLHAQAVARQNQESEAESSESNESKSEKELHSPPTKLQSKDDTSASDKKPPINQPSEGSRTLPRNRRSDSNSRGILNHHLLWREPHMRKSWSVTDLTHSRSQSPQSGGRRTRIQRYARETFSSSLKSRSYARDTISSSRSKSEKNLTKVGDDKKKSRFKSIFSKTSSANSLSMRDESSVNLSKSSSVSTIAAPSSPRKSKKDRFSYVSSPNLVTQIDDDEQKTDARNVNKPSSPLPRPRRILPQVENKSTDPQMPSSPRSSRNLSGGTRNGSYPAKNRGCSFHESSVNGSALVEALSIQNSKSFDSIPNDESNSDLAFISDTLHDNSVDNVKEDADRLAMPPPPIVPSILSRSRKDAFMKRTVKTDAHVKELNFEAPSIENTSYTDNRRVSFCDTIGEALSAVSCTTHSANDPEASPPPVSVSDVVKDIGGASPMDLPVKDSSPVKEPYLDRSRRTAVVNSPVSSLAATSTSNTFSSTVSETNKSEVHSGFTLSSGSYSVDPGSASIASQSYTVHKVVTTTAITGQTMSDRNRDSSPVRSSRDTSPTLRQKTRSPSPRRRFIASAARDLSPRRMNSPRIIRKFDTSPVKSGEYCGTIKSPSMNQPSSTHSSVDATTTTTTTTTSPRSKVTLTKALTVSVVTAPSTTSVVTTVSSARRTELPVVYSLPTTSISSSSQPLLSSSTSSAAETSCTSNATPVMSAASSSQSVPSSPNKFSKNSPDRGRLSLPLGSRRASMDSADDTGTMMETCTQTVTDLKRSVLKATNMYQKVQNIHTKMPNDKANHVLNTLKTAFCEVRTMIASVDSNDFSVNKNGHLMDRRDSTSQTTEDLTEFGRLNDYRSELSDSMLALFHPLLEQYSNQISDKVISIVQDRIMSESTESIGPTLETDC